MWQGRAATARRRAAMGDRTDRTSPELGRRMKFQCDRCKTRYSIADERVRGKILKIRCKNCSAVITVREPRAESEPAPERASTKAATPRAKESALLGAFQDVIQRPVGDREPEPSASDSFRPPDHFEQEWYVSAEGVQSGPFSLAKAKEWVSAQNPDDELHCWNEDFDDWLPVEKVSHFRGIRRLPPPPAGPPPRARSPVSGVGPRPASAPGRPVTPPVALGAASSLRPATPRPDRPEDTPKPLFGPTLAAIEAEQGPARLERTPKPLFGPTLAAIEAEQGVPHSEETPPPMFRAPPRAGGQGSGPLDEPTESAPPPAAVAAAAAARASTPPPTPADALPPPTPAPAPAIDEPPADESPADEAPFEAVSSTGDGGLDEIPGTEAVPEGADDGDLDFEIGEASRMVKLPMLAAAARSGSEAPAAEEPAKGLPGVARLRDSTSQPALGVTPLSDTALAGAQPEILAAPERRRPALLIPLLAGGAVVIAVAVGVIIYFSRDTEEPENSLGKSRLYGDELAYRPDEQVRVITKEVVKENPVIRWKTGSSGNGSNNGSHTSNDSGKPAEIDPGLPIDQRPLTPDDVLRVSRENALGNRRCYEHALKKDPFLDVKTIKVKLTVSPSGVVTKLTMSSHADTVLGECLQSRIRKWVFRKSPGGITTQLTLSFEQS